MIIPSVALSIEDENWFDAFPDLEKKVEQAAVLAFNKAWRAKRTFEIGLILTDNDHVQELNATYRAKDKPTNVLSFPQFSLQELEGDETLPPLPLDAALPLGDVFIAYDVVRQESVAENKSLEAHTLHMVVHGVLHLLGHDHMKTQEAEIMEKLECDILRDLGYPSPYPDQA